MHVKSWVIDGATALTGSPNFSNNGIEKSEELLTIIRNEEFITGYLEWFERLWSIAEVVNVGISADAAAAMAAGSVPSPA